VTAVKVQRGPLIGGQWLAGDGEEIESFNPATGELLGSVMGSSPAQVDAAVASAKQVFESWSKTSVLERVELCRDAHQLCLRHNDELIEMITMEVGKTVASARSEMERGTAEHFRRAAEDVLRNAGKVLPSTMDRTTTKRLLVIQQPVGVVAAVTPWNFPIDIAAIPIVYGLALGCTVVWKPSEYAPLCTRMFSELLAEAGFPAGAVNVVHGRGEVGAALVGHPDVSAVAFTGSVETGERVARDAGLKNRVMELGGNGPQIVLADGDIERAADAAVRGCFFLAGQCCTAAERLLVHEAVKDEFVEALLARAKSLRVGDPLDPDTDMGPVCTLAVLQRTQEHIADAVAKGARVIHGGGYTDQFHEPTILDGITSEMRIAQEETFGPVAPIMTFSSNEEAIEIANETEYGLTASVFTESLHDAWQLAEELRHGTVHINDSTNYWDQLAPFGGMKKSGAGRELSSWIIDALTETKQITFELARGAGAEAGPRMR
jgi:acyl-CoA reductase-like NAD-dependent aldehyde dehydrogenase